MLATILYAISANITSCLGVDLDSFMLLAGSWNVWLDEESQNYQYFDFDLNQTNNIELPGTLDDAGLGMRTISSANGRLSRKNEYVGVAWYQREVEIPQSWKGKDATVFLERVMWQSELWFDQTCYGTADSLGTPHVYLIKNITPGKHIITIRIDNSMIYNIGDCGHTYTDFTQTKWNGILGQITLTARDSIKLENVQAFTDTENKSINLRYQLANTGAEKLKTTISYTLTDQNTGRQIAKASEEVVCEAGVLEPARSYDFAIERPVLPWSEFSPKLYKLTIEAISGSQKDSKETTIGFRKVGTAKSKICINDKPVFIRGNINNAEFPKTAHPPMDVESWERIFKIHKDHGMNNVRFHSWCPPEAAFIAADRVGIYIQPETLWIADWMKIAGRSATSARPEPLGTVESVNGYIESELNRIIDAYGNHPSFVFFCVGNELDNADYDVVQSWMDKIKARDGDRRLYSLSASWYFADNDQYKISGEPHSRFYRETPKDQIQDLGYPRHIKAYNTDWDYEELYSLAKVPMIAHEIGQRPMYPLWSEIEKYQGTLAPRNYVSFMDKAIKNGVYELNEEFSQASGKLSQLLYKYEIEAMFRTPSCAGFELLGMQDYPGQGEALVGWLDAFYDSKGITTAQEFKRHCDQTVLLMRSPKMVFNADEPLEAKVLVSHFGQEYLDIAFDCSLSVDGQICKSGKLAPALIKQGEISTIGSVNADWNWLKQAAKVTLEVKNDALGLCNSWDLWVYPELPKYSPSKDIAIATTFDESITDYLKEGGKVLLVANKSVSKSQLNIHYSPLYWSLSWFPGQENKTIGTYVRRDHPALKYFPTDSYTGVQWAEIYRDAKGFYLGKLPAGYQPIVQPIYDFHENLKVGSIFEFAVGKGKMLVCGYDILADNPACRQLNYSLIKYMESEDFNPSYNVSVDFLNEMFGEVAPKPLPMS